MLIHSRAVTVLHQLLQGESGLAAAFARTGLPSDTPVASINANLVAQVPVDLSDDALSLYPVIHIYCERVTNNLAEKFNSFSGLVDLVIEVRVSDDSPERIGQVTGSQVEAVLDILRLNRGPWADGIYFSGKYEVQFPAVRRGGNSLIQIARVKIPVFVRLQ